MREQVLLLTPEPELLKAVLLQTVQLEMAQPKTAQMQLMQLLRHRTVEPQMAKQPDAG